MYRLNHSFFIKVLKVRNANTRPEQHVFLNGYIFSDLRNQQQPQAPSTDHVCNLGIG